MRKLTVMMSVFLFGFQTISCARSDDRPIPFEELPAAAQTFIKAHFADSEIALVTRDTDLFDKNYNVVFTDGGEVEFNRKGDWKSVDLGRKKVPDGIIPEAIRTHVIQKHSSNFITEIDRDTRDYEIQLDNGIEIRFDLKFNVIGYDN